MAEQGYKPLLTKKFPKKSYKVPAEIRHWKSYKTAIAAKEPVTIQKMRFPSQSSSSVLVAAGNKANLFSVADAKITKSFVDNLDIVTSCAIRSDGKIVITGNRQGIINVYQTETKYLLRKYTSHKGQINTINLSSSNLKLVSGSNDLSIKLWDLQSSDAIYEIPHAHDDLVKEVLFADESENLLVSAGYDRIVKIWDPRMEKPLVASAEHELSVEALAFGESKDQLIAAYGNSCAVWDLRQMFAQGPVMTLQPHLKGILTLAYDKVRKRIITGGADSMLKFIDPKSGKSLYTLKTESPPIAFDMANNSTAYALGTNDGSIIVRTLEIEEENKEEEDLEGIIINTETKSTKVNSKGYRYFYRGAYVKAKDDEIKSAYTKKLTLQDYERYFKQFDYRSALLEAIKANHPEIVLTVLEELVQRNVLCLAISHLDSDQLLTLMGFIKARITNPKYSKMMFELSSLLIDMYSCVIGLNKKVDKAFIELKGILEKEYRLQTDLISLKGMIESVQTAAAVLQ